MTRHAARRSPADTEMLRLRDGATVIVRPMRATDVAALRRMGSRLSPRTVYRRFMASYPHGMPDRMLRQLATVDHLDREALVASHAGEIVAVARYHRTSPGVAELAVLVEDAWQRRGLARSLTLMLSDLAHKRGIDTFRGTMLAENDAAYGLLTSVFPGSSSRIASGEREFNVVLTPALRGLRPPRAS